MKCRIYAVHMGDGSIWGVPAQVIADNRAKYYADCDPNTTYQAEFDAMIEWFDSKDYEFQDWAQNNMNWDDVKEYAFLIKRDVPELDFQDGWVNGECEYIEQEEQP